MNEQLAEIVREFRSAGDRLRRLSERVPDTLWAQRPLDGGWSVGECVAHLNLTSAAFLPALRKGVEEARELGRQPPRRYRRDLVGWLLWRIMGPPARLRAKTATGFVPAGEATPAELRAEFERLQEEQIRLVEDADGLPLASVRIPSPFDRRVKYNLFSAFSILPRHQHRHLWQAERAAEKLDVR